MLDRAWSGAFRREIRKSPRANCRPQLECLEGRRLLNASLAPLPNISVPDMLGYQVPLDGSGSNASAQNFTVTSSNPDINASVATGQFLTLTVSHQAANANDVTFGVPDPVPITFQLFQDLTPTTYQKIESFVNSGFYNGSTFHRIANMFNSANEYIVQGGQTSQSVTPYGNELVQQLAFTNPGQVALANTGAPNSNGTEFFFTTGVASNLNSKYTIFGQIVSGLDVVNQMTKVAGTPLPNNLGMQPINPINIVSATLSSNNPNGVVHIDATKAKAGETSTINVTATDPSTNTTAMQSFQVVVPTDTGEVRQIGDVLVVTPLPRTDKGTNNILVTQLNDPTNAANDKIQVLINNQLDIHQPLVSDLESNGNGRIVVFGSKAGDTITVDPSVDSGLAVTLDGGHGGHNTLKAGAGPTREHGWFGRNTLIGGAGPNELVGRAGRVKFRPSSTTDEIFAGVARPNFRNGHIRPPGGTFFKFVNGKLIPTTAARTGSA